MKKHVNAEVPRMFGEIAIIMLKARIPRVGGVGSLLKGQGWLVAMANA